MNRVTIPRNSLQTYRRIWQASLFCFILAALTGALYRFGMIGWMPQGLSLLNIRHAHSHLMFFGWAVPLPLYILLLRAAGSAGKNSKAVQMMRWSVWGGLIFGLISYPFFLLWGYQPVAIGSASIPLSVAFAGLVMLCWYVYMGGYLKIRSHLKEDAATSWYDAALLLLFISSLGAWGVAVLQAMDLQNPLWAKAMTHFFLASFTEGWVVLAVLALIFGNMAVKERPPFSSNVSISLIVIGAPLTFPYGISESLLTPVLLFTARLGGVLASAGIILALYVLWKRGNWKGSVWTWPLGLLLLKGLMQLGSSVIPSGFWLSDHALRILYLHVLLLGALTLGSIAWLHVEAGTPYRYFSRVVASVLMVLASLVMMSRLWPPAWSGLWVFYVVTGAALLPAMAVAAMWHKVRRMR